MSASDDMSEEEFADYLTEAMEAYAQEYDEEPPRVETFKEAAVMTSNKGLVVRFGDVEFELTIVRRG